MVLFERRVQRAAEEELLGEPVDHGDEHDQRQAALGSEFEDLGGVVPQRRESRGPPSPPSTKTAPSASPMTVPLITGRWLRPKNRTCPRCNGRDSSAPNAHTPASANVSP